MMGEVSDPRSRSCALCRSGRVKKSGSAAARRSSTCTLTFGLPSIITAIMGAHGGVHA